MLWQFLSSSRLRRQQGFPVVLHLNKPTNTPLLTAATTVILAQSVTASQFEFASHDKF